MATKISTSKALLVEGNDDCNFFEALLDHVGITGVTIRHTQGAPNFPAHLDAFINDPGFGGIDAYGIVRDADQNPGGTFASIVAHLRTRNQPTPDRPGAHVSTPNLKVGVFLMPGIGGTGMLEDLCLQTVRTHPAMPCLDRYFECLASVATANPSYRYPRNIAKAKAQAFLAAMEHTVPHIGVAAKRGIWDFASPDLAPLRNFLEFLR